MKPSLSHAVSNLGNEVDHYSAMSDTEGNHNSGTVLIQTVHLDDKWGTKNEKWAGPRIHTLLTDLTYVVNLQNK